MSGCMTLATPRHLCASTSRAITSSTPHAARTGLASRPACCGALQRIASRHSATTVRRARASARDKAAPARGEASTSASGDIGERFGRRRLPLPKGMGMTAAALGVGAVTLLLEPVRLAFPHTHSALSHVSLFLCLCAKSCTQRMASRPPSQEHHPCRARFVSAYHTGALETLDSTPESTLP